MSWLATGSTDDGLVWAATALWSVSAPSDVAAVAATAAIAGSSSFGYGSSWLCALVLHKRGSSARHHLVFLVGWIPPLPPNVIDCGPRACFYTKEISLSMVVLNIGMVMVLRIIHFETPSFPFSMSNLTTGMDRLHQNPHSVKKLANYIEGKCVTSHFPHCSSSSSLSPPSIQLA